MDDRCVLFIADAAASIPFLTLPLQQTVGYSIRLESKLSERTCLTFVTTGVLLRRLQDDGTLEGVSHVIVDEGACLPAGVGYCDWRWAHERTRTICVAQRARVLNLATRNMHYALNKHSA